MAGPAGIGAGSGNELLLRLIEKIHADPKMKSYGSPRVHAELTLGMGLQVNEKRVARLMREAGIQGLYYRRRSWTTVRDPDAEPWADLVNRQFDVDAPNRLWLTDITEHPTEEGKLYCAAVMDAYGRRIIGYSMADHLRTDLVLDALSMAITRRPPVRQQTILHSDHGTLCHNPGERLDGGAAGAKYLARGDEQRHDAISRQLGVPAGDRTMAVLRQAVEQRVDLATSPSLRDAVNVVKPVRSISSRRTTAASSAEARG